MNLSIIVLTKNEEEVLAGCLKSASFADELIVFDSFSTDKTIEIAKTFNAKISQEEFKGYALQREKAKELASSEWILFLDADERITQKLREEIISTIAKPAGFSGFFITRDNYYLGKLWPTKDKIQRLFKKDDLLGWEGDLHETPKLKGSMGFLTNSLIHLTHRDIESMTRKTLSWSVKEAELRFKTNHPKMTSWRFIRVMLTAFYDSFVKQKGYKAGTEGWVESIFQSFSMFMTYVRLWEMQRDETLKSTYKKIDEGLR